jgi:hypothetical protein
MILKPTLPEHEDIPRTLIKDRYSPVDTTSNVKLSSTFTEISGKKRTSVSLQPARRPAGMRGAPELPYSCDACGERYSQLQGVSRHRRRAHNNPHSCLRCSFKWSRPYQYRDHLKKHHPDVDRDYVLGKPAGSRRRSTIIGRDRFSVPAVELGQLGLRSRAEPRQHPIAPPLSAPTKVTHASSPAMSPVICNPQPKYAEQAIRANEFENAGGFKFEYQFLGASDPPSAFSSRSVCPISDDLASQVAKFGWHMLLFTPHM